jgi:hypothetical protein
MNYEKMWRRLKVEIFNYSTENPGDIISAAIIKIILLIEKEEKAENE